MLIFYLKKCSNHWDKCSHYFCNGFFLKNCFFDIFSEVFICKSWLKLHLFAGFDCMDLSAWKTDHLVFSVACRFLRISGYRPLFLWPWKMAFFCMIYVTEIYRFMAKTHPDFISCIIFLCQIAKSLTPISALWN